MAAKKFAVDGSMYVWAGFRALFGFIFLWAFFDKALGLGFSTCKSVAGSVHFSCSQAWVSGGSPTKGFLSQAATGPFASFYHRLAGNGLVDLLFMLGLLFVGLGLFFGLYVRAAAFIGIIMLLLMWSALLWPANTPGIDEHLVYALVLFGVALADERQVWGLRSWWLKTSIAKSLPFLR